MMNRLQLMMDVKDFYNLGWLSLYPWLNSIDGLRYETEYPVLDWGFKDIQLIHNELANTKYYPNLKVK